ncbi:uncharacterized protein LOC122499895 [Leptopilina heterotoma]|uniref:uncharacterized protein LOC122499895 n=1 Tax=Leptopilina heterotoma TaxID=63436 RepID=UPI001CA9C7D5|nr:uncharacterized protein LOC122499895 [Leptopilina heterotoma]
MDNVEKIENDVEEMETGEIEAIVIPVEEPQEIEVTAEIHAIPSVNKEDGNSVIDAASKVQEKSRAMNKRRSSFPPLWKTAMKIHLEVVEEQKKQTEALEKAILAIEAARNTEAIRIKVFNEDTYKDTFRQVKKSVDPSETGTEILSIRRSRKQEMLVILRRNQGVSSFSSKLAEALKDKADVCPIVTKRSLEIRDLDETTEVDEVTEAVSQTLGRTDLEMSCRLIPLSRGEKIAVVQLPEADADSLLKTAKVKIGWINCRIRPRVEVDRCFRCLCYGHLSKACQKPDRSKVCWKCGSPDHSHKDCKNKPVCLTCVDKGEKEINHNPGTGSCPIYKEELRKLRARN